MYEVETVRVASLPASTTGVALPRGWAWMYLDEAPSGEASEDKWEMAIVAIDRKRRPVGVTIWVPHDSKVWVEV